MPESGTHRSGLRRGVFIAVALVVAASAVGSVAALLARDQADDSRYSPGPSLATALTSTDVVVRATTTEPTGESFTSESGGVYSLYETVIDEIVWVADGVMGPSTGVSILLASAIQNDAGQDVLTDTTDLGSRILFLGLPDRALVPNFDTDWGVILVAYETPSGVTFPGPKGGLGGFEENLSKLTRFLSGVSPEQAADYRRDGAAEFAVLMDWLEERQLDPDAQGSVIKGGPISEALSTEAIRAFERDVAWWATDPAIRPLDPELTPPDVLAGFELHSLMIDVSPDAKYDGVYLVVVSDMGVVHSAELAGGSHPTSVYAASEESLKVWITDDLRTAAGTVVASIDGGAWGESTRAVLISVTKAVVDDALVGVGPDPSVSAGLVSELSAAEMQDWIDHKASEQPPTDPHPAEDVP